MKSKFISLFLFIFSFLFLWFSRPAGVGLEDSGGFFLSACNFGISHPPGYPLFNLLGGLSRLTTKSFLDCIDSILLLNISLASGIIVFCYQFLMLFIRDNLGFYKKAIVAIISSLALLVSRSFSFLARSSEVYILHLFFVIFLLFILLKLKKEGNVFYKNVFYFVLGLSFANHWPLILILFPFFISYIYYLEIKKNIFQDIIKSFVFFAFGFSIYIYYFINPFVSEYYFYSKVETIAEAIHLFLRKDQSVMDVLPTWELMNSFYFTFHFFERISFEFGVIVSLLGVIGTLLCYPIFILCISIPLFLPFLWRTEVNQFTLEMFQYWELSSYIAVIIGFSLFMNFILVRLKNERIKNFYAIGIFALGAIYISFSILNQAQFKKDSLASDYSRLVLDSLPKNSILFVHKDTEAGIIGFENYGREYRKDIDVISQVSALFPKRVFLRKKNPNRESQRLPILNFISKELDKGRRVFTTRRLEQFNELVPFPMKYSEYGIYFEINYEKIDVSLQGDSIQSIKNILILENDRRKKNQGQSIFISKYNLPWKRYREFLTRDLCHTLLIFEGTIDGIENLPECRFIYAQWIHVNQKQYELAEEEFRNSLSNSTYLYKSELVERYRDFLLNRISYINSLKVSKEEKRKYLLDTIVSVKSIALDYKYCENKLAKILLNLANELSLKEEDLIEWNKTCK
ncbi:MAG TPA: DUF2723 domain-containing protein [Leptospiraceae bacterium]|nr:DUF2723 domain-containing protein [Leptospiraceae bacterium]HMX31346.1 DUF2723 domain-containing protein [Leptospiraceae bacterium]HMY31611.1 DUF2723 domain-containing protein [Leptospiraceae bacterium]HMZ66133.1 DUF2723 domain-containing protein [Leptospiraceae bacterium]HNB97532.1 DUF2723 domain-containing protein [Leptospiraceae bacterium]